MRRIDGWEIKLDDFIRSRQYTKFEWGEHDCTSFACDAIKEITSTDVLYWFRGRYRNKITAYELLKEFSGGGLIETFDKLTSEFGMSEIEQNFAGRGDLVLCNVPTVINEELPSLGIIGLSEKIYIPGTRQLQIFEKTIGEKFWKV
jgi:hypothetical protein|tara:strand:- start:2453 stop:2890 length:438 start_codon:yes stop_codon:yes gene_type:complete